MTFKDVLAQVIDWLQQDKRLSYRALKRQFVLDDDYLDDLKTELIEVRRIAVDEDGRVLVWTGDTHTAPASTSLSPQPVHIPLRQDEWPVSPPPSPVPSSPPDAERRQLTVLFCDLVDSTALASRLDPEDLREVVRAYQQTCAEIIQRFEGYIAQYLGDGLLVYFGYPQAHEDDAQRAVRTGLGMVEAMRVLHTRLAPQGIRLAVRIGVHTGVVVVGEMGGGGRQEQLALGETPNIAARLQSIATPDTVIISEATAHLIQGYFVCQSLGAQTLKGVTQPLQVSQVLGESGAQTRFDVVTPRGLTPLVGRDEEMALVHRRWAQATTGMGQVVLLSGEAGIGKSRLAQVLKDAVAHEPHIHIEWRGSPYHQQSVLYPVIDYLHRLLRWQHDALPSETLRTLETTLAASGVPLSEAIPLLAALLSLPLPASYPPLILTPQRQRQKTLETIVAWLHAEAQRHPILLSVEDLHWVDPSTLELLSLLIDQAATMRLCLVLTARPEFHPPWTMVAHVTSLTLRRFTPLQVERVATHVAGDKVLPSVVLQEIVRKTDGVPLFVEELTKAVLASGLLEEQRDGYALHGPLPPLAIPATLHDALMARLDRLATVKLVAQLGATIGRSFTYDLMQAVAPLEATTLHEALAQLVEEELVAQRGIPPQATYTFKHALIQDTAYQSLLRSTRQHYHLRIAQVLETHVSETIVTQPELLAHHYTEAGLQEQAVGYWQRAGQRAVQRSAHAEALSHLSAALALLQSLPETPERTQHELDVHILLGPALMATQGYAAPGVEHAYARARELCQQMGETPELFSVLWGLWYVYFVRAELQTARELGEQCLTLAQRLHAPELLLQAHRAMGQTLFWLGELIPARAHLEQGMTLYDPRQHASLAFRYGMDPGVGCHGFAGVVLWMLGYPAQALEKTHEALTLARELSHPFSLVYALGFAARLHQYRREGQQTQEQAEATMLLATEQGFPEWVAVGAILRGWGLAEQGREDEAMGQMRQGLVAYRATGAELWRPYWLALLAEAYGKMGQADEGLRVLAEGLVAAHTSGQRSYEAELYRLKGELLRTHAPEQHTEAAACFQQALDVARRQEAKSLELRAATGLAQLWQHQGKYAEAHALLAPIYRWFTEGFDTADLQDARALLDALGG